MSTDAVARRVVVQGRVQGVCFRDACSHEARRAGVTGWIRNEPDGSVAAMFEGPPAAVEEMVRWCHQGPRLARVDTVRVTEAVPDGTASFDVLG